MVAGKTYRSSNVEKEKLIFERWPDGRWRVTATGRLTIAILCGAMLLWAAA